MNNVHCVVSDIEGQVVSKCSGGMVGLKHRARAAPLAGIEISRKAVEKAVARGFSLAHVRLKGPSRGRGQLLQASPPRCLLPFHHSSTRARVLCPWPGFLCVQGIAAAGMRVADIRDVTPYPTNGCRPPSARRL